MKPNRRFVDGYDDHTPHDDAEDIFAPDVVLVDEGIGLEARGIDDLLDNAIDRWLTANPDAKVELIDYDLHDGGMAATIVSRGTFTGELETPDGTVSGTTREESHEETLSLIRSRSSTVTWPHGRARRSTERSTPLAERCVASGGRNTLECGPAGPRARRRHPESPLGAEPNLEVGSFLGPANRLGREAIGPPRRPRPLSGRFPVSGPSGSHPSGESTHPLNSLDAYSRFIYYPHSTITCIQLICSLDVFMKFVHFV